MLLAGGDHRACGVLLASLLPDRLDFLVAFGKDLLAHFVHFGLELALVFGHSLGIDFLADLGYFAFEIDFLFGPFGLV